MSHAVLSPSSASRWLACTPSARLEERFPDSTSDFAREGTLAHEVGEITLLFKTKQIKKNEYERRMLTVKESKFYTPELQDYAEGYAAFVLEAFAAAKKRTKDAVLNIEAKLDLTEYVPDGFGTGDAVIIADRVLNIIDLKFGKGVAVSADNNKQMMLYALGALRDADFLYDIDKVMMTIYQPRLDNISEFEMSVNDLKQWAEKILKPKAKQAFAGEGEFKAGDHCRFCRVKATCKALADYNLELIAKNELADSFLLSDSDISEILSRADGIKKWLASVEEYALTEAVDNGKTWEGFKLVEGRSNRAYADREKVAEVLTDNGFKEDDIYSKELLGITAMEKAITKKKFLELLSDLVIKPQGKPTLVPASDKREAINSVQNAIDDFQNINSND